VRALGVTVARTPAEVEALREAWEALPVGNPAADPDHLLTLVEHSPEPMRPHVILLEQNGRAGALAVGRVGEARLEARFGYQTILRPRVDALVVSQGGVVGAEDERAEALLAALLDALRHDSLDLVRLRLRVGSPLHRLATTKPGRLVRGGAGDAAKRWRARVPGTHDEFLRARSAKTRSNVQRYARRLEGRFGDGIDLRVFGSPVELPQLVADSRAVYEKTYQHGLHTGLVDDEIDEALRRLAAARGWLRAFVLYLDGVPRAFWHGNLYRRIFFTGATGYDPEYRDLRLGTYVLSKMAEYLCGQADWIDFGLGDAEYKRHFGDESWDEEDVLLFARRPRPIAVNLSRSAVLGASHAAKVALARSGRLDSARRRWRGRLADGHAG
jgi:CelD/BcsL family acetyltransferase involved in cellulose biosynthesis